MKKNMFASKTHVVFAALGIAIGGMIVAGQQAAAVDNEEITVSAPRTVHRKTVGTTYTGAPIEEISLNRRVSYAGLDLRRQADMNELERRISYTANEACKQLNALYPDNLYPPVSGDKDCVKQAVDDGMEQARTIVSSR